VSRIYLLSTILLVSVTAASRAQVSNPAPAKLAAVEAPSSSDDVAVFRTGTRLVQVDVVVRGKDAPIRGLTKNDFEITDRGKKQTISIFAVREAEKTQQPVKLPVGVVTNRPLQSGPEPVTATVILIDRLNTAFENQAQVRAQAMKLVQRMGQNERVAIYSLNLSLTIVQPFTADRDALRKAIEKSTSETTAINQEILQGISGNAANAANLNALQRRAETTSYAFEAVARHLKGLPGRKKLLWITAALPLVQTQQNERNLVMMNEFTDLSPGLFKATRVLNDANVAIYVIDARGLFPGVLMDENIAAMRRLSEMTGGTAFYADNDLATGMEKAINDTDLTYTLGFYPSEELMDGAFHSVSVKVLRTRAGTQDIKDVRYRRGYDAETARPPLTDKQRKGTLNAWVDEPLDATEIGIQAAGVPSKKAGFYDIEVAVDISDLKLEKKNNRWIGVFELAVVPDVENRPKGLHQVFKLNLTEQSYANALAHGFTVVNQIRVTNDKGKLLSKRLHFVVMDGISGKSGSVRIPIAQ
jgi:VWFA-related protein